jgi:asparagine synthetase B (glutamine-hydrolysing)
VIKSSKFSSLGQLLEDGNYALYVFADRCARKRWDDLKDYFDSLEKEFEQYSAVLFEKNGKSAVLRRSITSSFNLYYGFSADGDPIISDCLVSVRDGIPREKRSPEDRALLQCLLFRTTLGSTTFARGVSRVEHGEEVRIDSQGVSRKIFDHRCMGAPSEDDRSLYEILSSKSAIFEAEESAVSFSGGVDSMVLASIFSRQDLVFSNFSCPEFENEYLYAVEGASFLGRKLKVIDFKESDFLKRMQDITRKTGYPIQASLMVHLGNLIEKTGKRLIIGQCADAVFGFKKYHAPKSLYSFIRRSGSQFKRLLSGKSIDFSKLMPDHVNLDPFSTRNFANSFADSGAIGVFESIFGEAAVSQAYSERFEYVANRIECRQSGNISDQMEVGHFIDFFCENSLSCWREVAKVSSGEVAAPFADFDVFNYARSIPSDIRYVNNGELKWVLKSQIRNMVPNYNAKKRKLGGSMPNARLSAEGRFGILGRDYDWPGFLPQSEFERIRQAGFRPAWAAHSLAVGLDSIEQ